MISRILCKIFGHKFYSASEECDKIKCIDCNEWFDSDDAYGQWV